MRHLTLVLLTLSCLAAGAMEIDWVRTTGRWALESAPLVTDLDGDDTPEILALNRGGQIMLWRLDGSDIAPGPDGLATTLPEGEWSSTPVRVDTPQGPRIVACSNGGLVIGLSPRLQELWRYQLPGETTWAKASPAVLDNAGQVLLGYMDRTGVFTVLDADGRLAWSRESEDGTGGPLPGVLGDTFLVPLGSQLVRLSSGGNPIWSIDLKTLDGRPAALRARPTPIDRESFVCVCDHGLVIAYTNDAAPRWQAELPEELDNTPAVITTAGGDTLVVITGLWGNAYAFTAGGRLSWTHLFRSKNRGTPLFVDAEGDGKPDIVQGAFSQHLLAFGQDGRGIDDLRLNGLITPSLTPIPGSRDNFFVATASLLAYRIRPGVPRSPYGDTPPPRGVTARWHKPPHEANPLVRIENPAGALLAVNVALDGPQRTWVGALTSRSFFDLEVPMAAHRASQRNRIEVRDPRGPVDSTHPAGAVVFDSQSQPTLVDSFTLIHEEPRVNAWPVNPHEPLARDHRWHEGKPETAVAVDDLYVGEAGQAAFAIGADNRACDARIELLPPAREDGALFRGSIRLFRVVPVGSLNGAHDSEAANTELVPDALVPIGPGNVVAVPARDSAKVWLAVDARGAEPGIYNGTIKVTWLANSPGKELPLRIEVLPLRMPDRFPLTLCTWDYVPNKWFPDHTQAVLDDMGRHGVDVFPRNVVPEAIVDASGELRMDYAKLDVELDRLQGRGEILFHVGHPAIAFAVPPSDEDRLAAELTYLREFVAHLEERGLDYDDYALYPVDEPGLSYQVANVEALLDAAALFRRADRRLRLYTDPVPTLSWESFERIAPTIDVWCPNMRQVSGLLSGDPRILQIMDSDVPVWSYECVSQVKSLSPLRYNRANAWRAWFFGLDGIGFWTHSQAQKDMWYPSDDEFPLVYPGEFPVPSVRWEAVRDGLEDVAAMALLEEEIAKHRATRARLLAVREAEEALAIAKRDIMELSDAAYVETRDYLREGDRRVWHLPADIETYRRHRAVIADLTLTLKAGG